MLYAGLLGFKDGDLLSLALYLSLLLLILLSELGDVLVAVAHHFGVEVEEGGVLDQTLLELVIFLEQLALFRLELEFLLRELFLFVYVGFLVLVHFAALVKKACRW